MAREELTAARLWAAVRAPYLSSALFALTPVEMPGLGTFVVDKRWRLYVDPAMFDTWTLEEVGTVLLHEVHHVIRDHAGRAVASQVGGAEHRRWNVAADLEINDDLTDLALPAGGCLPAGFGVPPNEVAETYFTLLEADHAYVSRRSAECGSGCHGQQADWEVSTGEAPGVPDGEATLIRQQVASEVRTLAARGAAPGGLARWADGFLRPRVDWRKEFRSLVLRGTGLTAGAVDYSYRRPNRRSRAGHQPRVLLPSLVRPTVRVAVVVDTSASMSNHALEAALGEVAGILSVVSASREPIAVLSCDAGVHAPQRVFSASAIRLAGGGGTDMGVGLAAAAALRPSPQVVIVLTDGLTLWPEKPPAGKRVIVGLIGEEGHAPGWARSVRIPPEGPGTTVPDLIRPHGPSAPVVRPTN